MFFGGPDPPKGLATVLKGLTRFFWGGSQVALASRPSPCEFAAARGQDLCKGLLRRSPAFTWGLGYFHQEENQWSLGWLEAGLCFPMYGKSPEGLCTSTLHRPPLPLLPLQVPTIIKVRHGRPEAFRSRAGARVSYKPPPTPSQCTLNPRQPLPRRSRVRGSII